MSSPNMNNILLMGCILCYISVFIKPLEVSSGAVCKVNVSSYMSHVIVIVISIVFFISNLPYLAFFILFCICVTTTDSQVLTYSFEIWMLWTNWSDSITNHCICIVTQSLYILHNNIVRCLRYCWPYHQSCISLYTYD